MINLFTAETANEAWLQALAAFHACDDVHRQPSRAGDTREILHAVFTIRNPRHRWVVSRTPPINPAFAIAEVVWILSGRNDSKFLNYWNSKLPNFAGKGECYHGAYGYRLRKQFGFDQLDRAYRTLKENPQTRQVVLQIWDSRADFPDQDGRPVDPDIPCNVCALLKVRKGKLEWFQVLRSNDLFLGVPYNLVQFTTLQEVLAGWLELEVGDYNHLSDSLHLYETDYSHLKSAAPLQAEQNTDSLALPRHLSEPIFTALALNIEALTKSKATEKGLVSRVEGFDAPEAFRNLLFVMGAEAARRRHWVRIADGLILQCTNPALKQLWQNWITRSRKVGQSASLQHLPAAVAS